jgi:G3E family GTPase
MSTPAIPVSVLTGFLGSGKTTMLGHLLRQPEFSRTAVIINEFGEVGLDHELIEASDDSLVELTTGCLCCRVRSDLVETLSDLLQRRDERRCTLFDRIVIETSGLTDPTPILQTLMTETSVAGRLTLDSVVTTVDAVTGAAALQREDVSKKQVAVADRIVLTKLDLAGDDEAMLRNRIASLNSGAPVLSANQGQIDPGVLFGVGRADPAAKIAAWLGDNARDHRHSHDADITTFTIVRDRPIRATTLTFFLEALAGHCGERLLRLKGIVNIAESPERPAIIHGVQHVFHPPAWLERWPSAERRSRIVFIARGVPQRWAEVMLEAIEAETIAVAIA